MAEIIVALAKCAEACQRRGRKYVGIHVSTDTLDTVSKHIIQVERAWDIVTPYSEVEEEVS